ncbi:MAG: flagellar hook-length control protein FliK [Lachnospiraceae bacterium]|nr:flagellar hook-length control protein FliK [Lachnospiraceae bacterium]
MAIDLLGLFSQTRQQAAAGSQTEGMTTAQQNYQLLNAVHSLQAGQTLRGEILSVKGNDVQIAIMKDVIISARMDQNINLSAGTMMTFQVKSNNTQGMSIRPLFTNTAADPNISKALLMAGLPEQESTVKMVYSMMERGMSVDKNSLLEVFRDMTAFKEADIQDILSLRQMGLPVTEENLAQLKLYENNQHFLSDTFSEIGNQIAGQIEHWAGQGDQQTVGQLLTQLRSLFLGTADPQQAGAENGQTGGMPGTDGQGSGNNTVVISETLLNAVDIVAEGVEEAENTEGKEGPQTQGVAGSEEALKGEAHRELSETTSKTLSQQWDRLLADALEQKDPEKLGNTFRKVWELSAKEQWMMEPEMVEEKGRVKEFYEKLEHQMQQLEHLLSQSAGKDSGAAKSVQTANANLDFMNQMNQMYAYVQLPLKLANQQAKGELYVYTNKKNLAKQEGRVTALLHLSMEHLGEMDVYVAMENLRVNTQFYLENEEFLDFLEERMHILTERLNKRGYECSIQTNLRKSDEAEPMISKIADKGQKILLSTQAFDVRA